MQGLPLSLSGVRRIMENMDWGDVFEFVSFGNVGSDHLDDSTHYVIVAPQNVVGSTIMTKLLEMVQPSSILLSSSISLNAEQLICTCAPDMQSRAEETSPVRLKRVSVLISANVKMRSECLDVHRQMLQLSSRRH